MSAQVRIGGDGEPNEAAVLDLNADGTTTGTKGLALPRVSLSSDDVILPGVTENLDGMLVYNTSGSLPAGVYFWNGSNWIMGSTDTIPGGGLTKTDDGKIGVIAGGITSDMLADGSVSMSKTSMNKIVVNMWSQNSMPANGTYLDIPIPATCNSDAFWYVLNLNSTVTSGLASGNIRVHIISRTNNTGNIIFYCW